MTRHAPGSMIVQYGFFFELLLGRTFEDPAPNFTPPPHASNELGKGKWIFLLKKSSDWGIDGTFGGEAAYNPPILGQFRRMK